VISSKLLRHINELRLLVMPCRIGARAIDPDAAGERIVAFALPGKHPAAPF
jgi:hypothetical protein